MVKRMTVRVMCAAVALCALYAGSAFADISGTVRDNDTMAPVAGARVHVQADLAGPVVITGADGTFTLPVNPVDPVFVTAGVTYDASNATNWATAGTFSPVMNGATGVEILLPPIPAENPAYEPLTVDNSCSTCHVNQVAEWQTSNHALASVDFMVRDLFSGDGTPGGSNGFVFKDTHPGQTGFCATCHTPIADAFDPGNVMLDEVTDAAELEGVSCIACHQLNEVNENVNELHVVGNATYSFPDGMLFPTSQYVWGPLDDVSFGGMRASYLPVFEQSRLCASCHQYEAPFGQTTYEEWQASPFAVAGPNFQTCQDCHMVTNGPGRICTVGADVERPAERNRQHTFVGSTPETLSANLRLDAVVMESEDGLMVRAEVENFGAGHKFPTGVSIRNALLVIEATYNGAPLAQIAGPMVPSWADDDVPGIQPGDYGGQPGTGYAKILEGRINGMGAPVTPVLFIDAETVLEDSGIPSGATDVTTVTFALPPDAQIGDVVEVQTRLLYRRAFRALQVTKGWTVTPQGGPFEIEVATTNESFALTAGSALDIPTLGEIGGALLVVLLAMVAVLVLRRRVG